MIRRAAPQASHIPRTSTRCFLALGLSVLGLLGGLAIQPRGLAESSTRASNRSRTPPATNSFLLKRNFNPWSLGNYANTSVQLGANITITPDAVPTATTSIDVATSTDFKGTLEGDPTTGIVRITDAHPAGVYTVTVTAFDGGPSIKTFTLTVTTPAVTCNPVTYAAPASSSTGTNPFSVAVGDFNRDGKQDLVTANRDSSNVSVLLGDGGGSFSAATNFAIGPNALSVAVGDFNGDGKQDLVTANRDSNDVSVLLGDGAGSFSAATNFSVGANPFSVAVGDFNSDGRQDLAVSFPNAVSVLMGDGAGSFGAANNFSAGNTPLLVAVGDFNGDGKQDLVTANSSSNNVSVLLGDNAGSFSAPTDFAAGSTPSSVTVGDFNGDGKQDLAVANENSANVSVLLGDGAGGFAAATNFTVGLQPLSVRVGDFNGDGNQDLAAANTNSNNVSVLLGNGTGGFGAATNFSVGAGIFPTSLATGDFNGDGKQDLVTTNLFSTVSVLLRQCPAANIFAVTNTNDSGAGSLRQAIIDTTAHGGTDTIVFQIPGGGVHRISPGSALPDITDPTIIDGTTQPGYVGVPLIELDGTNAGPGAGLVISAGNSTVRGLVINRFGTPANGDAILLETLGGNVIEACYLGTDATGTNSAGGENNINGIHILNSPNNQIGGNTNQQRNVISGNASRGIIIEGVAATGNFVQGNFIGTAVGGNSSVPNGESGLLITQAPGNTIGGLSAGERNVISGNGGEGIHIVNSNATGNSVIGNYIGVQFSDGVTALPNDQSGVRLSGNASNNGIGGILPGAGNIIANNGSIGVWVDSGTGNSVRGNNIYGNGNIGIDLADGNGTGDGVTPNDAGDPDTGANNLQNFPVLTSASSGGGNTIIHGTFNSTPTGTFRIEFFSNNLCDGSGNGEGEVFLGSDMVVTDSGGNFVINSTLPLTTALGQYITATATSADTPNGNTSEFSNCVQVALVVVNTNDAGAGSLRQAIIDANARPGPDTIIFDIPGAGVHTIIPASTLPTITEAVTIDGYTQPGASPNTQAVGDNAVLLIELNGNNLTATGLNLQGGGSTVRGFVVNRFNGHGIQTNGGNTVEGCFIGINPAGVAALGNAQSGVFVQAFQNKIGGTTPAARNVISGNQRGVFLNGASANLTFVYGNYIGTDKSGNAGLGNTLEGILINAGASNQIGADISGAGNLVSGNGGDGLATFGSNTNVQGNFFGLNATGTSALPNLRGINLHSASNGIGGTTPGARNIISGNTLTGIELDGAADLNVVQGNLIGLNLAGLGAVPNGSHGISLVTNASNNVIGGTTSAARNVISGNLGDGIAITNGSSENLVQGNYIGVDQNLDSAIANSGCGIRIDAADSNQIGGSEPGAGNLIANNGRDGIRVIADPGNRIISNSIRTNGSTNLDLGIDLGTDGVTANDAGDADSGANALQNFPVITSATSFGANIKIQGTLNSTASSTFLVQFFSNFTCSASGNGEGQQLLGSINVVTDAGGNASFNAMLSSVAPVGTFITATATDSIGNTSEFSACQTATVVTDCASDNFSAAVNFPVGNAPNFAAASDFNGDGKLDLVAVNNGEDNVSILLGNGSGSFGAATNFAVGSNPTSVAVGDFNNDGKQDLAVANLNSDSLSILIGTGAGGFGAATTFSTGDGPFSVAVGDFDGDGNLDLAAANSNASNLSVLLGDGSGSFSAATDFAVDLGPRSVTVGDFNKDGLLDLVAANGNSGDVSILLGDGTGSFGAATNFVVGDFPNTVVVRDFNDDGNQDLATANRNSGDVSILLGDGTGNFNPGANVTLGTSPVSVTAIDLNGDGNQDLAVDDSSSTTVSVLLGDGAGAFGPATNISVGNNPRSIAAGDFNNDGKPDLVTANNGSNNVSLLLNNCISQITYIVNSSNDVNDGACDATHCSLREAILAANASTTTIDTITFNIAGAGVHTISPSSALPNITDPVTIDGATQPGYAGTPLIELNGAGASASGLMIFPGSSKVRALIINRFAGAGIILDTGGGNTVEGCYIGTNAAGSAALGNGGGGVRIIGSANNQIGGTTPAKRNVISGNTINAVEMVSGSTGNLVQGNYLGTNAAGTALVGNTGRGVVIFQSSGNTIGGPNAGARNLISGNGSGGVTLSQSASNNIVAGNFIGTDVTGTTAISNLFHGVSLDNSSLNNTIGGLTAGAGNIIAFNQQDGVNLISGSIGNRILGNSIFANGTTAADLGIDLVGTNGVDANDAGDADSGPNNLQNFPVVTSVKTFGANTEVAGTFNSTASTVFTLQFFSNPTCDASGNGEGQQFLGATSVLTDGAGNASFNATLTSAVATGTFITATATDAAGNSSEFSACSTAAIVTSCGSASFGAATNFATGTVPNSVAVGDFNGDGKQDVVTANGNSNNVSVLLGNGAGGFSAATSFGVGSQPQSLSVGDFNGDGNLDLVTGDPAPDKVTVLLGNGAGGFGAPANFSTGDRPKGIAVGDFNGDGKQDLATANFNSNNLSVLLGNGAGSFGAATNFGTGTSTFSVAVGDFNGDGKQDLAASNNGSDDVSVLLGNGAGGFSAATNFGVGSQPISVAVGDFNGDGKQDLAVANQNSDNVSVLLGNGAGSFSAATNFAAGDQPFSVAVGDLNGDGKQDIATVNESASSVSVLLGDGAGSFSAAANFAAGAQPFSVAVGDFNADGKPDLATANTGSDNVSVLLNNCTAPAATTFTVNSNDDVNDGACDVTHCSLREAIIAANANAGFTDTIAFNIAGAGVHTISPASALPTITDPVIIDGYTQPGSSVNTQANSDNAVLQIELDGPQCAVWSSTASAGPVSRSRQVAVT